MNMASSRERFTDGLLEKARCDSLMDCIHITELKDEQKRCLPSVAEREDIFAIFPTRFEKNLIF